MARDVFISYRSDDKMPAERICAGLERKDISCWIAPRDILAGKEWATAIVEGIQRCHSFVLVLSSNSKNAKQIAREVELADNQGIPIITFRLENVQPPPELLYFLGNVQWLDAFGDQFDSAIGRLAEVIRQNKSYPAERTSIRTVEWQDAAAKAPAEDSGRLDSNSLSGPRAEAAERPKFSQGLAPSYPAPVPKPAYSPAAPANNLTRWIGIGVAAVAVLGLVSWFGLSRARRSNAATTAGETATQSAAAPATQAPPEVKAMADRFLSDRHSGNNEAAWSELTQPFREHLNRTQWETAAATKARQHGDVEPKFNGCSFEGRAYVCDYILVYKDGFSEDNKLWVVRTANDKWAISGSIVKHRR